MFRSIVILLFVLLCSCAPVKKVSRDLHQRIVDPDQIAYADTLDTFALTHRVSLLREFQADHPDSVWSLRAETLALYALEVERRKTLAKKDETLQQQLKKDVYRLDKESEQLKQLNKELIDQNKELSEQLNELKGLLIQQEQRSQ